MKNLIKKFSLEGRISENHAKDIQEILQEFLRKRDIEQKENFEAMLAEIIDDLYLKYKEGFCDYENKTHKLGIFKEEIKYKVFQKLNGLK